MKNVIVGVNDLATTHPELSKQADGWDPRTVIAGTGKKLNWICKKGHKWDAAGSNRVKGSGCPICANQKLLVGYNDLATTNPQLASEADGWDPKKVFAGTSKKLNWKCKQGHRWSAQVQSRNVGGGCPFCANKKVLAGSNDLATTNPELAEQADGWDPSTVIAGTDRKLNWICEEGHRWDAAGSTRVKGVGCPVCSNHKLLIGYNDLATTNPELAMQADGWDPKTVVAGTPKKLKWKCQNGHRWDAAGSTRVKGVGCPVCVNKEVSVGYNDLATTNPELAEQADGWDPKTVIAGTHKKLNWKCKKGHKWSASGKNRTTRGDGCPICANQKLLVGYNDLATTNPELAREADGWDTRSVIAGTKLKLKWKCEKGHKWSASGDHRFKGRGCPSCSKTGFDPNKDAYLYFLIHPKWELYQIGITNQPKDRLKNHNQNGFELLELRGPIDGHTARELETALLRFLKSEKANLSPEQFAGKFDGYSESWTIDSYKVNNLKELIEKASDAGF